MRLLLIALICLFFPVESSAESAKTEPSSTVPQIILKRNEPTHPENILIAFYKMAGIQPDFLEWARRTPFLKNAKKSDEDAIISREANRLQQLYGVHDTSQTLVTRSVIGLDNYSTLNETLTLDEFTPKTFFSYGIYGQQVAIVPKGIAEFNTLKFSNKDMEEILAKAGSNAIEAELVLKPVAADSAAPFKVDGTDYWLLLADIAEIRFWSNTVGKEPKLLWFHRADWYKPPVDKTLLDLKGGGL